MRKLPRVPRQIRNYIFAKQLKEFRPAQSFRGGMIVSQQALSGLTLLFRPG